MITIFFAPPRPLILGALPYGHTLTQNYLRKEVVLMLREENVRFRRKHSGGDFSLHLDNSRCHNGKKITAEIKYQRLA
jgi:hypothetical protein